MRLADPCAIRSGTLAERVYKEQMGTLGHLLFMNAIDIDLSSILAIEAKWGKKRVHCVG